MIWYFYMLQNDPHGKSDYHLSLCRSYYNIIDYSPWTAHYILMTYFFYIWKFIPIIPFYQIYLFIYLLPPNSYPLQ